MPAATSKVKRLFLRLVLLLNLVTVLPALLALLGSHLSAGAWWLPSVLSLLLPWILLPIVVWLGIWVWARKWKLLVVNLLFLAMAWPQLSLTWQYNGSMRHSRFDIKVLSMNVNAFEYSRDKWQLAKEFIIAQKPDIICLQEVYEVPPRKPLSSFEELKDALDMKYHRFIELFPKTDFGILIISRYPIIDAGAVTDTGPNVRNGVMFADLTLYGQQLRVYNMHLESYRLPEETRQQLFQPTNLVNSTPQLAQADSKEEPPRRRRKRKPATEQQAQEQTNSQTRSQTHTPEAQESPRRKRKRKNGSSTAPAPAQKPQAETDGSLIGGKVNWWAKVKLLLHTWRIHYNQVSLYRDHLASWGDNPVIVCGDLNNPPYTNIYRQVRAHLKDSFMSRGSGRGITYGDGLAAFRIDYVFHSEHLKPLGHKVLDTEGITDHKALLTRFKFDFH